MIRKQERIQIETQLEELLRTVLEDGTAAFQRVDALPDAHNRRNAFRVAFSTIEGLISLLKNHCLIAENDRFKSFSDPEIALLREEAYQLDDRGRVVTRQAFLRVADNLLFAWAMYFRSMMPDFTPDLGGVGWSAFRTAVVVRNRITHPKTGQDLMVSDGDLETLRSAYNWVLGTTFQNMARSLLGLRAQVYGRLNRVLPADVLAWIDSVVAAEEAFQRKPSDRVSDLEVPLSLVPEAMLRSLQSEDLARTHDGHLWITALGMLYFDSRRGSER